MYLFVIAGKARVGKTTLADIVARESFNMGYTPVILPFAEPIKSQAAAKGITKEDDSEAYRKYCQEIGQSMRDQNEDHWVNLWRMEVSELLAKSDESFPTVVIVDDCRYPNELRAAMEMKGLLWCIHSGDRELPEENAEWRNHASEEMGNTLNNTADPDLIDMFDFHISNDDTLKSYTWFCSQAIKALIMSGWDSDSPEFRATLAEKMIENLSDIGGT